jgi:hypothetical protein
MVEVIGDEDARDADFCLTLHAIAAFQRSDA